LIDTVEAASGCAGRAAHTGIGMNIRTMIPAIVLGGPAILLLAFGPRGHVDVPTGRTVVRYWEKWTGVEGAAMQRIVDRFNATVGAGQGIWVDYNALGDVDKRMLVATAGGDPPDVAGLPDRFVPPYADQGALLPLDDLAREHGLDLDAFKPIWIDICRYQDTLYALPSTPYTIALYYNRRLFREAGLDPDRPPRTTAELNDFALRLTRTADDRIIQLGFTVSPAMLGWWHWAWPYFFGGQLWDGRQFRLDTPATHAAMTWILQRRQALGNARVLKFEATAGAIESAQNPFLSERLAMVFQGPWLANWARVYAPELDYGVAPFPAVTGDRSPVLASTDVFVIPRGSRHPREAMIFLRYVLEQETMEALCRAHGKVSPFRHPGAAFFANHRNPYIRIFDALAASPDAFGYPDMPTWSEAWVELLYLLETILRGARDTDEAIRATQAKIDSIVSSYERMAARRRGQGS
jgi:ABC-type glycerol-3-phosphate transport system substrate-binding protein